LWVPISKYDSGTHEVGILVMDDSGLYDYQTFKIDVIDSSTNNPPDENCTYDCIVFGCSGYAQPWCTSCDNATQWQSGEPYDEHYDCPPFSNLMLQAPAHDCENAWCTTSANQCRGECVGGSFASPYNVYRDPCWDCVYPIVHSGDSDSHTNCFSILNKDQCLSHMPDCFWVKEKISNSFVESCYNDTSLNSTARPAYILIQ